MEVKAHLNRSRISPRKVRLVADLVRKMNIDEARKQLEFLNKKPTDPILKLINSAVANAKNNFDLSEDNLYISEIFVNEGQTMKRWRPRAMGRAARINKRTCCVTVVLSEMIEKINKAKGEVKNVETKKEEISESKSKEVVDTKTEKPLEKTVVKNEVKEDNKEVKDIKKTEDKKVSKEQEN